MLVRFTMIECLGQVSKPLRASTMPLGNPEGGDSQVLESQLEKVKPPQMYQVVLLNDDYTPMEFVVFVVSEFFAKNYDAAVSIMLQVHTQGRGVCGVFSRDVAMTKVNCVIDAARSAGHPLQAIIEPLDV